MLRFFAIVLGFATSLGLLPAHAQAAPSGCAPAGVNTRTVSHQVGFVGGRLADTYRWFDSKCLPRTVSLLRQTVGAGYNGGYAWQMTYQVQGAVGTARTVTVKPDLEAGDGGFGYFVSHERYRTFDDGDSAPIANKIFNTDDSPLGNGFPVTSQRSIPLPGAGAAAHRFTLNYRHYGTVTPHVFDPNSGQDAVPLPAVDTNPSSYANYVLPVTITWYFQHGMDFPRIDTRVSMANVPQADLLSFDVRGPYGVMLFDQDQAGTVTGFEQGNQYNFIITSHPPTRASAWTWNTANAGARFSALIASTYEMGLFEPVLFANSATRDGYEPHQGTTSAAGGCSADDALPCDFEFPYQSLEDSLPPTGSTNFKKIAWGAAAYYGLSYSPNGFNNFPANIAYSLCVVLGKTIPDGLTAAAALHPTQNCATAAVP